MPLQSQPPTCAVSSCMVRPLCSTTKLPPLCPSAQGSCTSSMAKLPRAFLSEAVAPLAGTLLLPGSHSTRLCSWACMLLAAPSGRPSWQATCCSRAVGLPSSCWRCPPCRQAPAGQQQQVAVTSFHAMMHWVTHPAQGHTSQVPAGGGREPPTSHAAAPAACCALLRALPCPGWDPARRSVAACSAHSGSASLPTPSTLMSGHIGGRSATALEQAMLLGGATACRACHNWLRQH
jgi:hypothetical protein